MTSGGSNFNDFPENQLTQVRTNSIKTNRDHAFFCSKQDFSLLWPLLPLSSTLPVAAGGYEGNVSDLRVCRGTTMKGSGGRCLQRDPGADSGRGSGGRSLPEAEVLLEIYR